MSESRYTRPSWTFTPNTGAVWGDGRKIAQISSANGSMVANGYRIAAAPDLLERLEWAHAQLCQHPDWCEANHPTLTAEHNAIRAAIAKAKGE